MRKFGQRLGVFLRNLGRDLATLRLPVTAAATVATVTAYLEPFGVSLGGEVTARITGLLVLVGVIYEYVRTRAEI